MFNNRDYEAVEIIMNYCFGKIFLMLNIPNNRAYRFCKTYLPSLFDLFM